MTRFLLLSSAAALLAPAAFAQADVDIIVTAQKRNATEVMQGATLARWAMWPTRPFRCDPITRR